ncbi:MAG: hypothetical protein AB7W16_07870 [Candidatus Obscuribacterales bacterium]
MKTKTDRKLLFLITAAGVCIYVLLAFLKLLSKFDRFDEEKRL